MCSDFNGTCTSIRIRTYCNAFRQILFSMIIIVNMHTEDTFMYFFTKRKHGFLCTTADKDFCILADSDIRPVIGWTDIIGNRLRPFIHDIFICRPADSRHAAPGQGACREGDGDDAG